MRNSFNNVASNVFNRSTALVGIVLLSPVFIGVAAASYADVGGPLFKEQRFGKEGKPFTLYKFKTMRDPQNERELSQDFDIDRVTKVGEFLRKTRLDELPQLWNIAKGDMGYIGHRAQPDKTEYKDIVRDFSTLWDNRPGLFSPKQTNPKHWRVTINQPNFNNRFREACQADSDGLQNINLTQKFTLPFKVIRTMLSCNSTGSTDPDEPESTAKEKPRLQP